MRKNTLHRNSWLLALALLSCTWLPAQERGADSLPQNRQVKKNKADKHRRKETFPWKDSLFAGELPLEMTISTDIRKLISERTGEILIPATVTLKFPDGMSVREPCGIRARGSYRKDLCQIPSFMLDFRGYERNGGHGGGKIKVVTSCFMSADFDRLVWKEYLAYRICNILTEKSFRVRLLNIRFTDTAGRKRPFTQPGFLIEGVEDMARRNNCLPVERPLTHTEQTDREQMTLIALFQYMIGNTDWAVSAGHNVKLMSDRKDTMSRPYLIPYDFDFSGLVNAPYATPDEQFGILSVTTRVYRGYARTMPELENTLARFRDTRGRVDSLISDFKWLGREERKAMLTYLSGFYDLIGHPAAVRREFVENARE
jgi:hypothetical protein